jgi:hypothetical protein
MVRKEKEKETPRAGKAGIQEEREGEKENAAGMMLA